MLTHQFANTGHFKDLACDLELPGIGKKQMLMNGCLLQQLPGSPTGILLAMENLTRKNWIGPKFKHTSDSFFQGNELPCVRFCRMVNRLT